MATSDSLGGVAVKVSSMNVEGRLLGVPCALFRFFLELKKYQVE